MFWSFQVLVNSSPAVRRVLSGTVRSSTKTAPSRQDGVGLGVIGLEVGDAVGGTSVGRVNPGLVGGRVEVTNRAGASVGASPETLTQAVRSKKRKRVSITFRVSVIRFFLLDFLHGEAITIVNSFLFEPRSHRDTELNKEKLRVSVVRI